MSYRLKNCPLCKGIAKTIIDWDGEKIKGTYGSYIQCSKCGNRTITYQTEKEAAIAWNNLETSSYNQLNLFGIGGSFDA